MKKMNRMSLFLLLALGTANVLALAAANARIAKEIPLMTKDLPDVPGKQGLVETVVLSPGEVIPAHRHNADVFGYVLEGSMVTQLKGDKTRIVHAGEVFYESPTDIHIASRNASKTQPAKLLVFFVKKIGAPSTVALRSANGTH